MANSRELFDDYQSGREGAAEAIFDRYVARMTLLARGRIGPTLRRRFDADDVVQSAFRSFFLHAQHDDYHLHQSGDLWRLLASITLHKLQRQIERQHAAKRSVHREVSTDDFHARLRTHEPSAVEVASLAEELQLVVDSLSPDERIVLTSTLQGQDVDEISRELGKSKRTARRLLAQLKIKLENRLIDGKRSESDSPSTFALPHASLHYSDYVLERLIGSGGMGKVYQATEKRSGKHVAIKALHKSQQSEERAVAQFVQEAEILTRLRHPSIVGVKGLGQFPGGGYFMVMDFVDGIDLQSRIQQGPLPLKQSIEIVTDVAHAIQYGHDNGVVHCDIKPANILLDKTDHVFVSDFGFAFLIVGSSNATQQRIGGTAGFIAPEILLRKSKPTPAADVYGLGMLLWTLATGKLPNDIERGANDLPDVVHQICRRCVANEPMERYNSPSELAVELAEISLSE